MCTGTCSLCTCYKSSISPLPMDGAPAAKGFGILGIYRFLCTKTGVSVIRDANFASVVTTGDWQRCLRVDPSKTNKTTRVIPSRTEAQALILSSREFVLSSNHNFVSIIFKKIFFNLCMVL